MQHSRADLKPIEQKPTTLAVHLKDGAAVKLNSLMESRCNSVIVFSTKKADVAGLEVNDQAINLPYQGGCDRSRKARIFLMKSRLT